VGRHSRPNFELVVVAIIQVALEMPYQYFNFNGLFPFAKNFLKTKMKDVALSFWMSGM